MVVICFYLLLLFYLLGILTIVLFVPSFKNFFSLVSLKFNEWIIVTLLSLLPLALVEITKVFIRLNKKKIK